MLEAEVLLWVPEVVDLVVVVLDDFRPYLLVDLGSLNPHAAMDRLLRSCCCFAVIRSVYTCRVHVLVSL